MLVRAQPLEPTLAPVAPASWRTPPSFPDADQKATVEGVETLKEVYGPVDSVLTQLISGIQSGLGCHGAASLARLRFVRVTSAGRREPTSTTSWR